MNRIFLVVVSLLLSFSVWKHIFYDAPLIKNLDVSYSAGSIRSLASQSRVRCVPARWSHSRRLSSRALHRIFKQRDRDYLTRVLWYELTRPVKHSLALPLLQYLIETEKPGHRRAYYKTLGAVAFSTKTPVYKIFNRQPRLAVRNNKIKVADLCRLYHLSSGAHRK